MLTINKLIAGGRGLAPVLVRKAAEVVLPWDQRSKSRLEATDSQGRRLGIFLARGSVMRGGDVLVAEDGSLVRVVAADEPVLVVRHCSEHGAPSDLMKGAYHLGNRHVPVELKPDHLKLEPDPVLAGMLERMHLIVKEERAPFEPEGGAYESHAAGGGHASERGHAHDHGHDHRRDHGHDHGHQHGHGHAHDHGHGHGHGHDEHGHGTHDHEPR